MLKEGHPHTKRLSSPDQINPWQHQLQGDPIASLAPGAPQEILQRPPTQLLESKGLRHTHTSGKEYRRYRRSSGIRCRCREGDCHKPSHKGRSKRRNFSREILKPHFPLEATVFTRKNSL